MNKMFRVDIFGDVEDVWPRLAASPSSAELVPEGEGAVMESSV